MSDNRPAPQILAGGVSFSMTAVVACILLMAAYGAVDTRSFVVRATAQSIFVGTYQIWGGSDHNVDPTYGDAIRAFGPATTCQLTPAETASTATWPKVGLTAEFATLGALPPGTDACTDTDIELRRLTLRDKRWRTNLGLHVGDGLAKLRRLYPHTSAHGTGLWIIATKTPALGPRALFGATMRKGRVTSFFFDIQAQRD